MTITLDRKHTVHWLAGYDKSGKHYYIDKNLPRFFLYMGEKIYVDKYLMVHERTEKYLEDTEGLDYDKAHMIATLVERRVVEKDGIPWKVYDDFMQHWIRKNEHEDLNDLPPDEEDPQTGKVYTRT